MRLRWGLTVLGFFICASLLFPLGCRFFDPPQIPNAELIAVNSLTGGLLLAERSIGAEAGARIEVERSMVVIPAGAREKATTAKWYRIPAASSTLVLPSGWIRRSDDYRLDAGDSEEPFLQPIRVTLPIGLIPALGQANRRVPSTAGLGEKRFVGMFSAATGWALLETTYGTGNGQTDFETWRPGIWVALEWTATGTADSTINPGDWSIPQVFASPTPLIAGGDGRWPADLDLACRIALPRGASGLIASGEWGLHLRALGASGIDLISVDGVPGRRIALDARGLTPRLDLLADALVRREWGPTAGTATLRLGFMGVSIDQGPRRLLWESRIRLPNGVTLLGEGEIGVLAKAMELRGSEPTGQISSSQPFRWQAVPDLTVFRRISLEIRRSGVAGNPLLAIDLPAPSEAYGISASVWEALPRQVPLEWRVIGIDSDGRRIVSEPKGFLILDSTATATGSATGTGTGTGTATDSPGLATPPRVLSTIPGEASTGVSPFVQIMVTFDREMASGSVEAGIRVHPPGIGVRTGWTDAKTLLISPLTSFPVATRHLVEIAAGVAAINGGRLVATFSLSFTTGSPDLVRPTLSLISPTLNASRVPPNTWVALVFSEPMARASTQAAIRVLQPVVGSLSYLWGDGDRRLEFLPAGNWPASAVHEIVIGSGATDLAGNRLVQDQRLSFTTRAETGPVLRWSVPVAETIATQAVSELQFLFDRSMDRSSTERAFRLSPTPTASPSFGWASADALLSVRFVSPLRDGASHTARIEASAMDSLRRSLAGEVTVSFRIADLTAPRVIEINPEPGSNLAINAELRVLFSEPVDQRSVEAAIALAPSGATGTFSWNDRGDEVTISPIPGWPGLTNLGLTVGAGVRDPAGNVMQTPSSAAWPTVPLTAPRVIRTIPADGAVGVSRTASLRVEFDAGMASDTLPFGFSLTPALAGGFTASWSADGRIFEAIPLTSLGNAVSYELNLGTGLRNGQGTPLAAPVRVRFTTVDTIPPFVLRSSPTDGASGVDPLSQLEFGFDEAPRRSEAEAVFRLDPPASGAVVFTWSEDGLTMRIRPGERLATGTRYTSGFGAGLSDLAGNRLSEEVLIGFTTAFASAPPPLPPAPRVDAAGVLPPAGAVGIASQIQIRLPFTLEMDHGVTESAFSLRTATGLISGAFTWEGEQLVFIPSQPLAEGTLFTIRMTTAARDRVNAQALAAAWISTFTTGVTLVPPTIQSTVPADGATGVERNTLVQIGFSKPMASSTVIISLTPPPSGTTLASWSADFRLLSLLSTGGFNSGTLHQVQIGAAARSLDGIALSGATGFSFTTGIATPPRVLSAEPADGAVDTASTTVVRLQFDREMDQTLVQAALVMTPSAPGGILFTWNAGGDQLEIRAAASWSAGVTYQFTLATTVRDLAGVALSTPFQSRFSVMPPPPVQPPEILATGVIPAPGAVAVGTGTIVEIVFSRPMAAAQTGAAFVLRSGVTAVPGTMSWPETTRCRFQPATPLAYEGLYRVEVATSAQDLDGRALAETWVSTFTVLAATLPRLDSTAPSDGTDGVAVNSPVSLIFTKPMATTTVTLDWSPLPAGTSTPVWSNGQRTLTVSWTPGLGGATLYQVAVNAAARDLEGLPLAGGSAFGFRTGTGEAPRILSTVPAEGAAEVARAAAVGIVFDRAMDQGSLAAAVSLSPPATGGFSLSWSGDGKTATIHPASLLAFGTGYQVRIGTGVRDLLSSPLAQPFQLTFSTETRPAVLASGTFPENGAVEVATNVALSLAFNKPMDHPSVEAALSLTDEGIAVNKTLSWSGNTLFLQPPASGWPASRTLVLSLTTAATDPAGNTLSAPFSRSFSTRRLFGSLWREILAHNPAGVQFPPRAGSVTISFQGALWVIGGYDGSDYRNDIWKSTDGITWQQVLAHDTTPPTTQFAGRAFHACVVGGDGKLYLTGGQNEDGAGSPQLLDDVWVTTTCASWTRLSVSAEYWSRKGHMMLANAGKLYILAGQTEDTDGLPVLLGDTWESSNGITWTEKSNAQTTGFFPRREGAAGVLGGKLWVWAGHGINAFSQEGPLNDVWYSASGTVWVRAIENASYTARTSPAATFHGGRFWMAGGLGQSGGFEVYRNDVWNSADGITWMRVREEGAADSGRFSPRSRAGLAESGGKLYLIGGEDTWESKNDVRVAE